MNRMRTKFKYNYDKRSKWLTVIESTIFAVIFILIYFLGDGNYLYAWIFSVLAAIIALFALSIPLNIKVSDDHLEIQCVVELTRIEIRDIASIRKVSKNEYKRLYVILGSYGFFGYYGYYFNFRQWEFVKVYATEWSNLVEIENIYEQKYLVSCRRADELIEAVTQAKLKSTNDSAVHEDVDDDPN